MMERLKNILSIFAVSRHAGVYTFLWGFIFSILVSSFVRVSPRISILLFIIALGVYGVERINSGEISKPIALFLILLIALALGSLRYSIKDFHEASLPGMTGVVASEPEHRDADTRFIFESDNGERVLVSTDRLSPVEYGDKVEVAGKLETPGVIDNTFDYGAYLSTSDVYYTESFAHVTILSHNAGNPLISTLLKVKGNFVSHIKLILPEPEASLLAGLVVAGKEALPASVLSDFKNAGVVHIVVLSGYNVTIIAEFFLLVFGFLGTRRAAGISALGIILFTLMTGATATVVRAAIMVLALLLGKIIGRAYAPGRMLLFTACLMLLWNPKYLIFDPSFQLSFLAMLALIYVVPVVEALAQKLLPALGRASGKSRPIASGLAQIIFVTIATQVVALPFLLYSIGQVSLVALFANILILFFVPFTMLIGFAAVLCAYLNTYIAWPLAFISHILLAWILGVAHTLGNLPFASITASLPVWGMILVYIGFGIIFVRLRLPAHPGNFSQPRTN